MEAALRDAASSESDAPSIIPSVSLEALLARREAAVAALKTIAKGVEDYQAVDELLWQGTNDGEGRWTRAPYKFREPLSMRPDRRGAYLENPVDWLRNALASLDASLWHHLLERSGLWTFLDSKARSDWTELVEKNETPPLTQENIRATFQSLHAQRGEFFERGVVAIFRALSWDYKTNRPQAFGKRLILCGVVSADGWPGSYSRADQLDDLDRAFHVLDRKPEPDHRNAVSRRLWHREPRHAPVETPYLKVKTFKNGNGHVELLRPDLVDELNRIIAKHHPDALAPHRGDPEDGRPAAGGGLVHQPLASEP